LSELYAGIDIGSLTAEAVVIQNGSIAASHRIRVQPHPVDSARELIDELKTEHGIEWGNVRHTVATGYGREEIVNAGLAGSNVSEISCHGFGAWTLSPSVKTIVDIGGQDAKAIRVGPQGELIDFVMNDKCAAGTGHFLELMSKALGVTLDELGPTSLTSHKRIEMSNRCSVFVETEVIHYLQRGAAKPDLAAGINRAMAQRVVALVRRVKPEAPIMMTGGVAKNVAVRGELERALKTRMLHPGIDPQLVGAYGAAALAKREANS
jgi:(R)-2-hydroxyacyl-CoA dehydratese activating ATPase